jgi:hypothetical protein
MNTISLSSIDGSTLTSGNPDSTGNYYWFKYDGSGNSNTPLTITGAAIGSKKVILLVDNADLDITGNITLGSGGFFMVIVGKDPNSGNGGNIVVDKEVGGGGSPNLEGLYIADGTFSDGTQSPGADVSLYFKGSLVANGGFTLQRDLGSSAANADPAEFFEYDPTQILEYNKVLGSRTMSWKEVAP